MRGLRDKYKAPIEQPMRDRRYVGHAARASSPVRPMTSNNTMRSGFPQTHALADAGADLITTITITTTTSNRRSPPAREDQVSLRDLSFTIETEQQARDGERLRCAIEGASMTPTLRRPPPT